MKAAFFHDGPIRFDRDGNHYNGVVNDRILDRYLAHFSDIVVATRGSEVTSENEEDRIRCAHASYMVLPNMSSLTGQFSFQKKRECMKRIGEIIDGVDFVIARVPSMLGGMAIDYCHTHDIRFLVEVVGCPWDSLRSHSIAGKLIAPFSCINQKIRVKHSPLVMYVTNSFLQKRYPTNGVSIGCSDVIIDDCDESILSRRLNKIETMTRPFVLGTCGILDVKYKGQEHVIKAIRILKDKGLDVRYQLVGQGDPSRLEEIAVKLNVRDSVDFLGPLPHVQVLAWLDTVDVYVQPSDTEGLCRALIEALSRACPSIASDVGGNSELVPKQWLFKKGSKKGLSHLIELMIVDGETMKAEATRNYRKASEYELGYLNRIRDEFYHRHVIL